MYWFASGLPPTMRGLAEHETRSLMNPEIGKVWTERSCVERTMIEYSNRERTTIQQTTNRRKG